MTAEQMTALVGVWAGLWGLARLWAMARRVVWG